MTAGEIEVRWQQLPSGVRGTTDGVRTIWLDPRLTQREVRATLIHEAFHVALGHTSCVSPAEEQRVRWKAAQYLLPNPYPVIDAIICAGGDLETAAEDLHVDRATVAARLNLKFMHPAEAAIFQQRLSGVDVGVAP